MLTKYEISIDFKYICNHITQCCPQVCHLKLLFMKSDVRVLADGSIERRIGETDYLG